jgi:hypothetical protein
MAKKKATARRLPGMETTAIKPIENAALAYEEARDERMAATEIEVSTQEKLLKVMHQHGKKNYRRKLTDGSILEVKVISEKEKAKVKHKAAKED